LASRAFSASTATLGGTANASYLNRPSGLANLKFGLNFMPE